MIYRRQTNNSRLYTERTNIRIGRGKLKGNFYTHTMGPAAADLTFQQLALLTCAKTNTLNTSGLGRARHIFE